MENKEGQEKFLPKCAKHAGEQLWWGWMYLSCRAREDTRRAPAHGENDERRVWGKGEAEKGESEESSKQEMFTIL